MQKLNTYYFANNKNQHFAFNADEQFLPIYQLADENNKKITHLQVQKIKVKIKIKFQQTHRIKVKLRKNKVLIIVNINYILEIDNLLTDK